MNKLITFFSIVSLIGCASKDLPNQGKPLSTTSGYDLAISAEVVTEYSDDYNILLQVNMENKGGKWARIDHVELDLSNTDDQPYNIVIGNDLKDWAEAKTNLLAYKQQNESATIAGTVLGGAALFIAGALSKNENLVNAGEAVYSVGLTAATVKDINNKKDETQRPRTVPETHLYGQYSLPSMGLVKKWVLVNVPKGRIAKVGTLKLRTIEGESLDYQLRILN